MYEIPSIDMDMLDEQFTYHAPFCDQANRYSDIRLAARGLAKLILESCPPSYDRGVAILKLREAVMFANASIAINEKPQGDQNVGSNSNNASA